LIRPVTIPDYFYNIFVLLLPDSLLSDPIFELLYLTLLYLLKTEK